MISSNTISLESESGFRVLFQCATIAILVVNERGEIELSNPCAEKLFGYEPAELIGMSIEILIPQSHRHKHSQHREKYFDKPNARPMGLGMELYACKKNGDVFPVEISLGSYELEGDRLAVAFVTDITNQVKIKKIMAEREAWFRNMADNSPVMMWVADAERVCTYFNNTWLEFTGRTIEEDLGNGWVEEIYPSDLEAYLLAFNQAYDDRKPFLIEYRLKRHDGLYRWVQTAGKPTFSSDNAFTGFIGSCNDIHDQRRMQDALEHLVKKRTNELSDALNREKELNELKSRFVSMASHEFRTPLSIVLSSTSLIEQYLGVERDERISKHLVRIKSSVHNLTGILNDFLSLDKLEQGNVDMENEVFNVDEFMNEVLDDVRILQKKGQEVVLSYKGDQLVVLDRKKLRYIMVNLLSNSIKYSSEYSVVNLCAENKTGWVSITVQDRGIGIPKEEQENMFSKFFRAKNVGSVQGTGLGLTIVKRYVELMGGKIGFVSKHGEGTKFTIELPQTASLL